VPCPFGASQPVQVIEHVAWWFWY